MLRILLALAVVGLVMFTALRMLDSQVGGVSRVTGSGLEPAASAAAPAAPGQRAQPAAQAVQQALEQGAALQAARASEAGR